MKFRLIASAILVSIGLISIFMLWQVSQIKYDYDFEAFFPKNHPSTEFFKAYRHKFEPDNNYVLIGIKNNTGVFNADFLNRINDLSDSLAKTSYVTSVISPTTLKDYRRYALFPKLVEVPFLDLNKPERFFDDSVRIMSHPHLSGSFFSKKAPAVILIIRHQSDINEVQSAEFAELVRNVVSAYHFDEVHYAGRTFGQSIYIDIIQKDVLVFVTASVILVILFLFLAYRSFWGIWMPLSVVGLTTIWTMGGMTITGKSLDLISNIIPTILMVIGLSSVVHLFTNYLDRRRQGLELQVALFGSMKEVGLATVFTTFTTMIGFLTLLNSNVQPIIELGIYTTLGLVVALFLTYTWFPSLIYLLNTGEKSRYVNNSFWNEKLMALYQMVMTHRVKILLIFCALAALGIGGSMKIKQNNYILEDLQADHPQHQAFSFIEENFAGARPFEMYVGLKDSTRTFFERPVITQLQLLDSFLVHHYGVGGMTNPVSIAKAANKINHQGKDELYKIPESDKELKAIQKDLFRYGSQVDLSAFLRRNHYEARISGFVPDLGSLVFNQKNEELKSFFESNMDTDLFEYQITGTATLVDLNTVFVSDNVIEGLLIAFIIIGCIIGIMFGSIKMAFISLLPNVFPLLVTGGIMGFFGIDLKMSTSLIFIISFGIAVDDSIHFLSRFKQELAKNKELSTSSALKQTFLGTGKAIVITSLIISGGFLSLCFSSFLGTFYIGILICATLIAALFADLFLLPALVLTFWKKN
ncbi:MAG: MMPL family transporter [Flavobacteriales bacterium]|nr:MMPL family transporter [Flavobacteriales bacterium]